MANAKPTTIVTGCLTRCLGAGWVTAILLGDSLPTRSEAGSLDETWNARIHACVMHLRGSDKVIRSNWRGYCRTTELDSGSATVEKLRNVFTDKGPVQLEDGNSCRNDIVPVATTSKCGFGSRGIDPGLLSRAAVQIRLPGNRCGSFIPISFTDQTDFSCNTVRSRIACLDASYDHRTDRTTITLSTLRGRGVDATTITFGAAEVDEHQGHIAELIDHPRFTIVPDMIGSQSISKDLAEAAHRWEQLCIKNGRHSHGACRRQAASYADAKLQETVRRYRNPRHDTPRDVMNEDAAKTVEFLRSKKIDQNEEQWILFLSIAANEVGLKLDDGGVSALEPIYGLSDDVDADSGLTFGAHQIDLGVSGDRDLRLFWDVIDAYKREHPDSVLDEAEISRDCLELPLRLMTVGALNLTYRSAPRMTAALRSAEGVDSYNKRLLSYLVEEVKLTAAKTGLFEKSMITRVLFSDLKNQVGNGSSIEKLADEISSSGVDLTSCNSIAGAEDKILESLIWNDPAHPARGKTQWAFRYENIRRIVRTGAAHGGLSGCS
jgi:hypothetical protein